MYEAINHFEEKDQVRRCPTRIKRFKIRATQGRRVAVVRNIHSASLLGSGKFEKLALHCVSGNCLYVTWSSDHIAEAYSNAA